MLPLKTLCVRSSDISKEKITPWLRHRNLKNPNFDRLIHYNLIISFGESLFDRQLKCYKLISTHLLIAIAILRLLRANVRVATLTFSQNPSILAVDYDTVVIPRSENFGIIKMLIVVCWKHNLVILFLIWKDKFSFGNTIFDLEMLFCFQHNSLASIVKFPS